MASGLSSTHKAKMLGGTFKLQNLYCQLMLHALQTKKTGYPLGNLGQGGCQEGVECVMDHPPCVTGEGI